MADTLDNANKIIGILKWVTGGVIGVAIIYAAYSVQMSVMASRLDHVEQDSKQFVDSRVLNDKSDRIGERHIGFDGRITKLENRADVMERNLIEYNAKFTNALAILDRIEKKVDRDYAQQGGK